MLLKKSKRRAVNAFRPSDSYIDGVNRLYEPIQDNFNWKLRSKIQWNIIRSSFIFIQYNAFEYAVWERAAISSRPQCANICFGWIFYNFIAQSISWSEERTTLYQWKWGNAISRVLQPSWHCVHICVCIDFVWTKNLSSHFCFTSRHSSKCKLISLRINTNYKDMC